MQDIKTCEKVITSPFATLYLGESNEKYSEGYLALEPHSSLALHNRPAKEIITQVNGSGYIIQFDGKANSSRMLIENEKIEIDPNIWHIHANPFDTSFLQHWYFEGDIRNIINNIRKQNG